MSSDVVARYSLVFKDLASAKMFGVVNKAKNMTGAISNVAKKFSAVGAGLSAVADSLGINALIETQREFDVLNASLITATGGTKEATKAFSDLQKFAKATPYSLEQSINAFTKLKNLGLDPSMKSMNSYGNFATAMGSDLNQMIAAVADASAMEFKTLKKFGITAKETQNQVSFTFQGVTTTVAKNSKAIQDYLLSIGETKFGDAINNRMRTLDGAMTQLEGNWNNLKLAIVNAGLGDAIKSIVVKISDVLTDLTAAMTKPENVEIFKSVLAGLGDVFSVIGSIADSVISSMKGIYDFFVRNKEIIIPLASGLAAMIGSLVIFEGALIAISSITAVFTVLNMLLIAVKGVGAMFSIISAITSPIGIAIIAIGALVAIGVYLYRNWDEIWNAIGGTVYFAVENIKNAWNGIKDYALQVWDAIGGTVYFAVENIKNAWSGIKDYASQVWNSIGESVYSVVESIKTIWSNITNSATSAFRSLPSPVRTAFNVIKSIFMTNFAIVKTIVMTAFNAIKAIMRGDFSQAGQIVLAGIARIVEIMRGFVSKVWNAIKMAGSRMRQAGIELIQGLINGIRQKIQGAINVARDLASRVSSTVKSFFNINSPSRLFASFGGSLPEGLAKGIKTNASTAVKQAQNMANAISNVEFKTADYDNDFTRQVRNTAEIRRNMQASFDVNVNIGGKVEGAKLTANTTTSNNRNYNNSNMPVALA